MNAYDTISCIGTVPSEGTFFTADEPLSCIEKDITIGDVYSAILNDMVATCARMLQYHLPLAPGFNCIKNHIDNNFFSVCKNHSPEWISLQKKLGIFISSNISYPICKNHSPKWTALQKNLGNLMISNISYPINKNCFSACKNHLPEWISLQNNLSNFISSNISYPTLEVLDEPICNYYHEEFFLRLISKDFIKIGPILDENCTVVSRASWDEVIPKSLFTELRSEVIRLWVASNHGNGKITFSMQNINELNLKLNKIQDVLKFLLSALDPKEKSGVVYDSLSFLECYTIQQLCMLNHRISYCYHSSDISGVCNLLDEYCDELHNFYFPAVKERLFQVHNNTGKIYAQRVARLILETLQRLIVPILPFTAQRIHFELTRDRGVSIKQAPFLLLIEEWKKLGIAELTRKDAKTIKEIIDLPYGNGIEWNKTWVKIKPMSFKKSFIQQWKIIKEIRLILLDLIEEKRALFSFTHTSQVALKMSIDLNNKKLKLLYRLFKGHKRKLREIAGEPYPIQYYFHEFIEELMQDLIGIKKCVLITDPTVYIPATKIPGFNVLVEHAKGAQYY